MHFSIIEYYMMKNYSTDTTVGPSILFSSFHSIFIKGQLLVHKLHAIKFTRFRLLILQTLTNTYDHSLRPYSRRECLCPSQKLLYASYRPGSIPSLDLCLLTTHFFFFILFHIFKNKITCFQTSLLITHILFTSHACRQLVSVLVVGHGQLRKMALMSWQVQVRFIT